MAIVVPPRDPSTSLAHLLRDPTTIDLGEVITRMQYGGLAELVSSKDEQAWETLCKLAQQSPAINYALRKELAEEVEELKSVINRLEEQIERLDETIGKSSFATADVALAAASRSPAEPADTVTESGAPEIITVMNSDRSLELATIEVIDQIERLVHKLKASGGGIPVVEKNARIILSVVNVLKFGISDPAEPLD